MMVSDGVLKAVSCTYICPTAFRTSIVRLRLFVVQSSKIKHFSIKEYKYRLF